MTDPVDFELVDSLERERVAKRTQQQDDRDARIKGLFTRTVIAPNAQGKIIMAECKLCAALVDPGSGLTTHISWHDNLGRAIGKA